MKQISLRQPLWTDERRRCLVVFLLGFVILLVTVIPVMIADGGYFIYYGDYNSQQIPFYSLANDAVRSGSFGWNWYTDLGANFIGSYSFYLLGSPFFWLSTILPRGFVTLSMPILLCLKHGIAALTAYMYIRRFVRNPGAAMIGGLLYAYSGFQLFNLFFNHFQDVTAFFPLMLIAMEELVNENRRGVFALSVALMATINYFFFTGQVVFLVLYFILRCPAKDFHASGKKFFLILLEAVIGVMIACVILLPSALAILANTRVSERLYGMDMIAYSDRTRIWRILYSLFMIPDVPARPNLFSSNNAKWASIGGYLPMFSMAGVIAFLKHRTGHWAKRLTIICAICACVPILNSAFYTFNGSYYARWFYMPILILAMMTAYALDNRKVSWKFGFGFSFTLMAAFGVISVLPVLENGKPKWFSFSEYPWHFYLVLTVCALSLGLAVYLLRRRKKGKPFLRLTLICTTCVSIACTMSVVYFGAFEPSRAREFVDKAIDTEDEISVSVSEDSFFRVDISESCDNYPMLWQLPSMRTFHSVVPTSIMEFYSSLGIARDVASRVDLSHYALRGLFSVQYYFDEADAPLADETETQPQISLPGFEYETTENGFHRFRNTSFIPMGFTFEKYISREDWDIIPESRRSTVLIRALVLDEKQIKSYGDLMQPLEKDETEITQTAYLSECAARARTACNSFVYDSDGFTATTTLNAPNLVFFSVPYDEGWSATVNGEPVEIEKVDVGFMAVPVDAGDSEIIFTYETPGLRIGGYLTIGGIVLLIGYLIICRIIGVRTSKEKVCCVDYDISAAPSQNENEKTPKNPA